MLFAAQASATAANPLADIQSFDVSARSQTISRAFRVSMESERGSKSLFGRASLADNRSHLSAKRSKTAGGIALDDARDGVADRAFVLAPPNYAYVLAKEAGSFLDCGADKEARVTDQYGRDAPSLNCSVTLTETMVIPAASKSARVVVHY